MSKRNENRTGYKKTKLGWIPEEWEVVKLGEIGEFSKGNGISKKEVLKSGLPCIRYGEIYTKHDIVIKKFYSFINKKTANQSYLLKKGDILFAGSGETLEDIGKAVTYIGQKSAYAGGDIIIFIPKEKINSLYYSYLLNSLIGISQKRKLGQGHSVVHIYSGQLKKLLVLVPDILEQKRIAEILSTWDRSIDLTEKLIKAKDKQKKALMQKLLTSKVRFKEFNLRKSVKSADNKSFTDYADYTDEEKWKNYHLKDFLDPVIRNKKKPSIHYLSIGIRSHGKGTFQKPDFAPEKIALETLYEVKENDLIVNITFAWEGAIAIVKKEDNSGLVSHRFPTYKFKSEKCLVDYFRYIIIQKRFRHLLGLISPGGAGRNRVLSKKDFLKLKWELPSVPEQTRIAEVLTLCDKEIELLKQKLDKLKEQKKGLMQKLLTGEIRVKY